MIKKPMRKQLDDFRTIGVPIVAHGSLLDMVMESGFVTSRSEASRLLKQGAVQIINPSEKVLFPILRVGKQRAVIDILGT